MFQQLIQQQKYVLSILALILLNTLPYSKLQAENIRLYIDADRTGVRASGISIEQGVLTALSEVNYTLGGKKIELVIRDHHGSSRRSKKHLQEYLQDKHALAIFSGLHSPPLLAHREFINRNRILLLDPWAAAGPITRYPSKENWIFRLSIDDSKAGYVITKHALEIDGFSKPYLLLEETGWGKSNLNTMTKALKESDVKSMGTKWFHWSLGKNAASIILRDIKASGADVIFMVANAPEGKTFARAMASLPEQERLPIRSHWGITGGDFAEVIDAEIRANLDLAFIQTRFSFLQEEQNEFSLTVLNNAIRLFPNKIKGATDIKAPAGFIHAYDLTRLLIAAINTTELTDDMEYNRNRIRQSLETLSQPIQGLIKLYRLPFSVYSDLNPDAHEALSEKDFTMARYGKSGEILLISN